MVDFLPYKCFIRNIGFVFEQAQKSKDGVFMTDSTLRPDTKTAVCRISTHRLVIDS